MIGHYMAARILIIDDDMVNIKLIQGILSHQPYQIDAYCLASEALVQLETNDYDLVLCDVVMPEMNGFEVTAQIKEMKPELPVIQMTSMGDDGCIEKAFDVGAVDFIHKPIRSIELRMRIRNILKINQTQGYLNLALSELNSKIQELEHMVVTDSLTGLYNHKYIIDRLGKEVAESKRYDKDVAVIMFDLDHFKNVNDNFGHMVGDKVLSKIANIIREQTRETDIAGRYGGEEFMVILPYVDLEGGMAFAEKIRNVMYCLKWEYDGLETTISAGVAVYEDGLTASELIVSADKMLYQAKNNGRNQVAG